LFSLTLLRVLSKEIKENLKLLLFTLIYQWVLFVLTLNVLFFLDELLSVWIGYDIWRANVMMPKMAFTWCFMVLVALPISTSVIFGHRKAYRYTSIIAMAVMELLVCLFYGGFKNVTDIRGILILTLTMVLVHLFSRNYYKKLLKD